MKKKRWVVTIVLAVLLIVTAFGRNLRTNAETYTDTENTIDFSELEVGDIL